MESAWVFVENDEVSVDAENNTQQDQSSKGVEKGDYDQRQHDLPSGNNEELGLRKNSLIDMAGGTP